MKKLITTLFAAALLACSGFAFAEGKIAVYDLQTAILSTDAAKKQLEQKQSSPFYTNLKTSYDQLRSELQSLEEQQKKNGATWSRERLAEHGKLMEYKAADFKLAAQKLQNETQAMVQEVLSTYAERAQEVVRDIVKTEKIGLVLKAEAVSFADDSYNITAKITDRLNKSK